MSVAGRPEAPARNGSGPAAPRRRLSARLSRQHWLAITAAAVAFVAVFSALRDRREMVEVAVARQEIPAATPVGAEMLRAVEVPADSPLLSGMVDLDAPVLSGAVTTRRVAAGEPLTSGALADAAPADGLRSMSLPVAEEHAVGGALGPGDRVDVLGGPDGEEVGYVATDLEVLAVSEADGGSLEARPTEFAVTVAVDGDEALVLARALRAEGIELVRSTGASPLPPVAGAGEPAVGGP